MPTNVVIRLLRVSQVDSFASGLTGNDLGHELQWRNLAVAVPMEAAGKAWG